MRSAKSRRVEAERGDLAAANELLDGLNLPPGLHSDGALFWRRSKAFLLLREGRAEEALQVAEDGVAAAQRDRQNWALHVFETWKGRQLLQMGQLADAAANLEGRFTLGEAHRIVGVLDAALIPEGA